jgi:hypothetical protein
MGEASHLLPACSCSIPELNLCCPFQGIPCGIGRLHTTSSAGAGCSLPRRGRTAASCDIASDCCLICTPRLLLKCPSPNPSQFTTDSQSVSMSWCRAPSGAHDQIVINCLTVAVLSCSCALSDERSGLSFVRHSPNSWSACT